MIRPMALDLGNACMQIMGPNMDNKVEIPHAVVDASTIERPADLVPATANPIENLHLRLTSPALSAPLTLFVGDLATREYALQVQERAAGEVKAKSERHLALALIGLAAASYRAWPSGQTNRLSVSVALPILEVKQPGARQAFQDALRQEYQVEWLSVPGWRGRKVVVAIEDVDVVPEGAAAYLALANREPGLQKQRVLVVDVGAGSLDWATFVNGMFQVGLSHGSPEGGVGMAADRILTNVHSSMDQDLGRHRTDVLDALRAGAMSGRRYHLRGTMGAREITKVVEEELNQLAKRIGAQVKDVTRQAGGIDRLLLVGGGGALLAPHLKEQCPDLRFELATAPEWCNTEGLYLRASSRVSNRGVGQ